MPLRPAGRAARVACTLLVLVACTPTPSATPSASEPGAPDPSAPATVGAAPSQDAPAGLASDPLHTLELYDVTSMTTFTLGELAVDRPVLFEMMAIWCTNCRAQQHQVVAAHDLAAFHSVSLDVDPNERPEDLADYSAEQGFGWRFALADQVLASALRERFGPAVLNPPSTPMVLLFPDGTVRALEFRAYPAEELAAEIAAG